MISRTASFQRVASGRKATLRQQTAKYAATILVAASVSFVSPLCPRPASAQLSSITSNLSLLQSFGAPIYTNLGLGSQSPINFGLSVDPNGSLYGTTATGGALNDGSVYMVAPTGVVQLLHSFGTGTGSGITPSGALTLGPDGDFYGVTKGGGTDGDGTVYQITPSGVVTTLHSFAGGATDGSVPTGSLSIDPDGTITGTTSSGGASNDGTVYQLTNDNGTEAESLLHSFTGSTTDGSDPVSGVIQAANGNLYGTTTSGGASGDGTVFQIAQSGSSAAESLVHSFTGGTTDGSDPVGGLIQTTNGALAGTTATGGANGLGTVYQITNAATQPVETVLASMNNSSGGDPVSALVQTADGTLLGTAQSDGVNGGGTVFSLAPNDGLAAIDSFENTDAISGVLDEVGSSPAAPLTQGAAGTLYGTTDQAGLSGPGSMYKLILPESVTGIATTRFDVNADGYADILFYNSNSGDLSYWDMDDQSVLQYGSSFAQMPAADGWLPVGQPDTTGDGQPDILFWNKNTGAMSIWDLRPASTVVGSYGSTFATISDTNWMPVAIANNKGDGTYEIVFQNQVTGNISLWHMDGQTVTTYGGTMATVGANSGWQIVGAPDLSGDGNSDFLFWNSNTGDVSYWEIVNDTVAQYYPSFTQVSDTDWHLVGAPDLNDDGDADLLWENMATGDVARWTMNGTAVTTYGGSFANVGANSGWSIQGER